METKKPLDRVGKISEVNEADGLVKIVYRSWDRSFSTSEMNEVYAPTTLFDSFENIEIDQWVRFRLNQGSKLMVEDLELLDSVDG